MDNASNLVLKRMGVINITPNSFSDGGEISDLEKFKSRLKSFGEIEAIDVGAESTAPKNQSISFEMEWERLAPYLPLLKSLQIPLSLDTYHSETIIKLAQNWLQEKITAPLIWNDVSGKFDESVHEFLKMSDKFSYVFCHNLAPSRELSGRHMDYVSMSQGDIFLEELADHLKTGIHERVIMDPTLGFSKTFEQNIYILNHFEELQKKVGHEKWLLGFSRKSFLRKAFQTENNDELDQIHGVILKKTIKNAVGELWVRTHRPELI
jgi:dihydropteroate synthase